MENTLYLVSAAALVPFAFLWNYLRRRKAPCHTPEEAEKPLPLDFGTLGYLKALVSWLFLFMRVYAIRPGLYRLNDPDENSPLLVTSNNYLTVFLLGRRIGKRKARLLVINTGGINVWCSAGKGSFSACEVVRMARRYGLLQEGEKRTVILPKFSLAGVKLEDLRKSGFRPVIGPMYARDLPGYLDSGEYVNRTEDRVNFGLRARAFTAVPTAVQFFYYFLAVYVLSLGFLSPAVIWTATLMAFLYPVLFPHLPGGSFSVKGISLAVPASLLLVPRLSASVAEGVWYFAFIFATAVFIGLSYTGNSAVSNYTSVRRETARYLPVVVALYLLLIPAVIYMGGFRCFP